MEYTIDDLEALITDVLDGEDIYDIIGMTGLSEERAQEIYELTQAVMDSYLKKCGMR